MIEKLNLLPWREQRRRQHQQRFVAMLVLAVLAAVALQWLVASYIDQQKYLQQSRNQQLQQEIAALERQLSLLPEMEQQREALVRRLTVIADIQQSRNRTTHLLSMMPAVVPPGVYLDSVSLNSNRIVVEGTADSNGRLAALLSNAETSPWLDDVTMHSIVTTKGDKAQDLINFKASFSMVYPAGADGESAGKDKQGARQ